MTRILYYVSGHGFGHAARSAEVVRALGESYPEIRVLVVTSAPKRLFAGLPAVAGEVIVSDVDTGVIEAGSSIRVDRDATVDRLTSFLGNADEVVAREVARVQLEDISLIVADMPYLAGEIAERAGLPSVAIGNFTWDWIYEPYVSDSPHGQALLARVREAYGKMSCYLRLPLSHDTDSFRRIVDIPLITRSVQKSRKDVLRWLGVDSEDRRRRVLFAMRDSAFLDALARAARSAPDRLFLYFGAPQASMPENARLVHLDNGVAFPDVLNVCDVVVSKLGYGTLSDCISTHTPILFPPRSDFREDEVFLPLVSRYLRAHELPRSDFEGGNWLPHLRHVEKTPGPPATLPMGGASTCASILAELCHFPKGDSHRI